MAYLETLGYGGSWASVAMGTGALPVLLVFFLRDPNWLSRSTACGSICIGIALTFYTIAFTKTDIVRVMVLFYMAPFWSLILERIFQNRKLRIQDIGSLLLLLFGIMCVEEFKLDITTSATLGDGLALGSGVLFALGANLAFQDKQAPVISMTLLLVLVSIGVSLLFALFEPQGLGVLPTNYLLWLSVPLLIGSLYLSPVMGVTIHAAIRLSPTVLTTLLSLEIISGFSSAAMFAGGGISTPQVMGAFLIIAAICFMTSSSDQVDK